MRILFVAMFLVCASMYHLRAQAIDWASIDTTTPPITYRYLLVGGGVGQTFQFTPGLRCADDGACPPFTGGVGISYEGAVAATQQLSPGWSLLGMLGIEGWRSTMTIRDNSLTVQNNGGVVPLERELTLRTSSLAATISAGIQMDMEAYRFWAAPYLSYTVGTPTWSQQAHIIGPPGITYPGGSTTVEIVPSSAVPNISVLRAGLRIGARYSVPLSPSTRIEPQVSVMYSPMSIQSTQEWTDLRVHAGVSLAFDVSSYPSVRLYEHYEEQVDTVKTKRRSREPSIYVLRGESRITQDTLTRGNARVIHNMAVRTDTLVEEYRAQPVLLSVKKEVVLADTISSSGDAIEWVTGDDGLQVGMLNNVRFDVITQQQQNTFTTLPLIFFDQKSSSLASRYRQLRPEEVPAYNYTDSLTTQLDVIHDVLNVIGYRMQRQTDSLVIRAYTDQTIEAGSCALARARAETVATYLQTIWGISRERLIIEEGSGSCTPPIASAENTAEGISENRRVELFTKNNDYYLPVVQQYITTAVESDLDSVEIALGDEVDSVATWSMIIHQGATELAKLEGTGKISTYDLRLREEQRTALASGVPIYLDLIAVMSRGDTINTRLVVPVEVIDNENVLTSLSLTTFDVRSSTLSDRDRQLVEEFLRRLPQGEKVSVLGYSDNRGQPEFNRRLSLQRAQTVAGFIRLKRPDCVIVRVEGIGSDRLPVGVSAYALPEERFMSRIVQLEIVR